VAESKTIAIIVTTIIIVGILVGVFFALGYFTPKSSQPGTVRVGYLFGDLHQLAYFVANNRTINNGQSFFEKYNVNVTLADGAPFANGGVEMDAFASGKVDIGYLGSPPAITKHLNAKINTTVIAQVNAEGSALVVKSDIQNFSDLRGKTVAVPSTASIQYFLLLRLAEQQNVSITDITVTQIGVGLMKPALESGNIQGFIAWEPFCSDAVVNGVGKVLANSSDIWPDHICCVLVADKTFANNHPEIVTNFLRAHIEATNWINNAKEKMESQNYRYMVSIASSFTGKSEAVIEKALNLIKFRFDIDSSFKYNFYSFTDKLIQYHVITSDRLTTMGYTSISDFVDRYVDTSYLTNAK
jgi:NitT/TauT family transport system substrate-binding protein